MSSMFQSVGMGVRMLRRRGYSAGTGGQRALAPWAFPDQGDSSVLRVNSDSPPSHRLL